MPDDCSNAQPNVLCDKANVTKQCSNQSMRIMYLFWLPFHVHNYPLELEGRKCSGSTHQFLLAGLFDQLGRPGRSLTPIITAAVKMQCSSGPLHCLVWWTALRSPRLCVMPGREARRTAGPAAGAANSARDKLARIRRRSAGRIRRTQLAQRRGPQNGATYSGPRLG